MPCFDCGMETAPCTGKRGCRHKGRWEYYVVHDSVWLKAGMSKEPWWEEQDGSHTDADGEPFVHQYLCVACLERRLHRPLIALDFVSDLALNISTTELGWDTPRLADCKRVGV